MVSRSISNAAYRWSPPLDTDVWGTADALNRPPTLDGVTLEWTAKGELLTDPSWHYFHDETGHLRDAWKRPAYQGGAYTPPDALNLTAWRHLGVPNGTDLLSVPARDGSRPEIVWERLWTAPEGQGFSTAGRRAYVLGPRADERLLFTDAGDNLFFPHVDHLGSTIAVSHGGWADLKVAYGPFGESSAPIDEGGGGHGVAGARTYPFRYTGQRLDAYTGLYDYKLRTYRPTLGRFLQPDPAGFVDGLNLYRYIGNDPMNGTDPLGLDPPTDVQEIEARANSCQADVCIVRGAGWGAATPVYVPRGGAIPTDTVREIVVTGRRAQPRSPEQVQRCRRLVAASSVLSDVSTWSGRVSFGATAVGAGTSLIPGGQAVAAAAAGLSVGSGIVSIQTGVASAVVYGAATGKWDKMGTLIINQALQTFGPLNGLPKSAAGQAGDEIADASERSNDCE